MDTRDLSSSAARDRSAVHRQRDPHPSQETSLRVSSALMYAAPFAALAAVGFGAAGAFGVGPRFLRRHPLVSTALACGGAAVLVKSQLDRFLLEQPEYQVVARFDDFEVREYPGRIVAETSVETPSFDDAREEGFRRLASFIFGENARSEQFSMTTPVTLQSESGSERLSMTTPVTLGRSRTGFVMRFQMPKERSLESLPKPKDSRVHVRRIGTERVAVMRFTGTYDADVIEQKQRELIGLTRAQGIAIAGEPVFVGYDSPATLPLIRRVEVWLPVMRV